MKNTLQITLLILGAIGTTVGDLPPGSNRYLPPDPTPGYNYNKPQQPFPTVTRPTTSVQVVTNRPVTSTSGSASISSFPTGPRPTSYPGSSVRPTPGFPEYNGQSSGNGNTFVPNQQNHGHGNGDGHHDHHDHHHEHQPGMPFDFNYAVKDETYGNDYSHNAVSDGDVVKGEYRVQLPDGRLQIVQYTADWKHGFNAQVSYQGEPRYDQSRPAGFTGYN